MSHTPKATKTCPILACRVCPAIHPTVTSMTSVAASRPTSIAEICGSNLDRLVVRSVIR